MKSAFYVALATTVLALPALAQNAQAKPYTAYLQKETPMKNTVVNVAVNSADHTTLVTAVKAAGLVDTLNGDGPFTVFAPTNAAFDKLPKGTLETLVKPESKTKLTSILTTHVVSGKLMAADVVQAIKDGKGTAVVTTLSGAKLNVSMDGNNVTLTDPAGHKALVKTTDLAADNGVVHVIDTVLMPTK